MKPHSNLACIDDGRKALAWRSAKQQAVENEKRKVRLLFGKLRVKTLPAIVRDVDGDWDWEWITETIREYLDWRRIEAVGRGNVSLGPWRAA